MWYRIHPRISHIGSTGPFQFENLEIIMGEPWDIWSPEIVPRLRRNDVTLTSLKCACYVSFVPCCFHHFGRHTHTHNPPRLHLPLQPYLSYIRQCGTRRTNGRSFRQHKSPCVGVSSLRRSQLILILPFLLSYECWDFGFCFGFFLSFGLFLIAFAALRAFTRSHLLQCILHYS